MQTQPFIDDVAQRAQLADDDIARRTTMATVETLCIYLPRQQTFELASQLPKDIAQAAEAGAQQAADAPEEITLERFFAQVATRAELPARDIEPAIRAAASVFKQALTRGESVDVVMDAPPDLDALLSG
ncbi:DUF2267 domain-containing protein [Salinisphaera sp. Q1T1-3]|uniref:DUF2267 domain-containing protein n=1 Tax=Salinisphaera sp. Q1T1-3 TaxID=2321229 RepID=UPI001314E888|nr:DUF2267 domain-containing protein [Salinisphaera sp. Q1T1-3]